MGHRDRNGLQRERVKMVVLIKIALLALLLWFTLTLIDAVVLSLHRHVKAIAAISLLVGIVSASLGLALLILMIPPLV